MRAKGIEEIATMLAGLQTHLVINGEVKAYIIYPKEVEKLRDFIIQVKETRKQAFEEAAEIAHSRVLNGNKSDEFLNGWDSCARELFGTLSGKAEE